MNVRLPLVHHQLGPGLQPRHVPLTGNRTDDPLVLKPELNLLSHTSQGHIKHF